MSTEMDRKINRGMCGRLNRELLTRRKESWLRVHSTHLYCALK